MPESANTSGVRAGFSRCRTNADTKVTLCRQREGQPRDIAHRSAGIEPVQWARNREQGGQRSRARHSGVRQPFQCPEVLIDLHQRKHRERAEQGAEQRKRPCVSWHDGSCDLRERDEDGISGRVRLMFRRVEVVNPEGEVQRIDVFERRRQEDKVRDQEQHREAECPEQLWGDSQTCRRMKPSFKLPER